MSYRFRMYPTEEQVAGMTRHCADARFVWNLGLEQRGYYRKGWGSISGRSQDRSLTEARKTTWLGSGSSWIQRQALRDLDQAFKNWWGNPSHFSRPTWRRAGHSESFGTRVRSIEHINHRWAAIRVPKVGLVQFKLPRVGRETYCIKSARITVDKCGRWFVSLVAEQPPFRRPRTGDKVGIDLGVANSVSTSGGARLDMPPLLSDGEVERGLRLERRLKRAKPASNRRNRTRLLLARVKSREADRRKDWIEKVTTQLVRDYDFIAIEDLKVKNMMKSAKGTLELPGTNVAAKRGLNRSIQNQGWAMFRKRLEDKAGAAVDSNGTSQPVIVVAVNPAYTSQCCSVCGHTDKKNRESQAVFNCQSCGHNENADVNAAKNILVRGLEGNAARLAVAGRGAIPSRSRPSRTGTEASTTSEPATLEAA